MKKNIFSFALLLLLLLYLNGCSNGNNPEPDFDLVSKYEHLLDRQEAQLALQYLNEVRSNPSAYSNEIGCNLSNVESRPMLVWNNQLVNAAERKALDMAIRNYAAHIDPDGYGMNYYINKAGYTLIDAFLTSDSSNNFESLAGGYSNGKTTIQALILDKGYPEGEEGHRQHLLGILPFWSNCYDVGIGFVRKDDSYYKTYCCILIAKHSW